MTVTTRLMKLWSVHGELAVEIRFRRDYIGSLASTCAGRRAHMAAVAKNMITTTRACRAESINLPPESHPKFPSIKARKHLATDHAALHSLTAGDWCPHLPLRAKPTPEHEGRGWRKCRVLLLVGDAALSPDAVWRLMSHQPPSSAPLPRGFLNAVTAFGPPSRPFNEAP